MLDRTDDIAVSVENWLMEFERALERRDGGPLQTLFHPESHWRDALALSWNLQTVSGADSIVKELAVLAGRINPYQFTIDPERAPPRRVKRAGTETIEAIFKFETAQGRGHGIIRLIPDDADNNRLKAWTLFTALEELKGLRRRSDRHGRAANPIRAIFADPTGSTSVRHPSPIPIAIPPCWWSAADRPGFRSPRG
jgi:hypothetical protein